VTDAADEGDEMGELDLRWGVVLTPSDGHEAGRLE
jgi:hypothetical protein